MVSVQSIISSKNMPSVCSWKTWLLGLVMLWFVGTQAHGGLQAQRLQKLVGLVQPEQIHLAFGDTAEDIVIMWATKKDGHFFVEIAETTDKMQKVQAERAVLEKSSDRAAKYLHRAHLSKLKPGETYVYRIVGDSGANSNVYSFKVPNIVPGKVHIFMIVGDVGLLSKGLRFFPHEVLNGGYEGVFHVGDIAYNMHIDEGSYGDRYLKYMETFAAKVPYMTMPGDHEIHLDYAHYRYRFSMPNSDWPMSTSHLWYSINIGPVCFISINTEVFYTLPEHQEAQLTWLRDQLHTANVQRQQHPWIIVLGHRPMYCSPAEEDGPRSSDCKSNSSCVLRSKVEDLFFEEGVDLYIGGHRHNYERSWPLYRGKVFQHSYRDPRAPVHIVNGAMGYEYLAHTISSPQSWTAFLFSDPRKELYARLEALNSTHLKWDVFGTNDNQLIDSIFIIQHRHGSFGKAGNEAYENLFKMQQLPPEPFHWNPPTQRDNTGLVMHSLYKLPPSTRRMYLWVLCCTLLLIFIVVLSIPRVRRTVFRVRK